ncbi:hypothetical protein AYI70_g1963 [Smittium culicis]|uniref:Uncharacterized protein n=1 Tax=Smittium culicis TaxID=133412 RepID=A0A1R1YA96_9FUNG|nr:hypothetical protein AYI70_g1963 [Smittium culicis]
MDEISLKLSSILQEIRSLKIQNQQSIQNTDNLMINDTEKFLNRLDNTTTITKKLPISGKSSEFNQSQNEGTDDLRSYFSDQSIRDLHLIFGSSVLLNAIYYCSMSRVSKLVVPSTNLTSITPESSSSQSIATSNDPNFTNHCEFGCFKVLADTEPAVCYCLLPNYSCNCQFSSYNGNVTYSPIYSSQLLIYYPDFHKALNLSKLSF